MNNFINGISGIKTVGDSRPQIPQRNLPIEERWIVQKFGGTSIGKFPVKIVEDIIVTGLESSHRIAVVCSARSSTNKSEGTTSRLLRAAHDVLDTQSGEFREIVQKIRLDHLQAGKDACSIQGSHENSILTTYSQNVNAECQNLLRILEAAQFLGAVTNQTEDMVISLGEKLSCLYMTALLQTRGVRAEYVDLSKMITFEIGKSLDEKSYLRLAESIAKRVFALGPNVVPVITGYFGLVPGGLLKEVGRGYTDLCAALTAVGLKARELQVWKEVDGIFTADPRKVPTARLLDSVTPSEVAELTFYGSEVIHPSTMDPVVKAGISIRIKNVMNPHNQGTVILPHINGKDQEIPRPGFFRNRSQSRGLNRQQVQLKRPTAVTVKGGITVLNVHSQKRTSAHGVLVNIFRTLERHHLSVDLISSSEVHVSMALHSERTMLSGHGQKRRYIEPAALQGAVDDLSEWADVDIVPDMAIISIVGRQLKTTTGISGRFLSTLAINAINIEMISQGASEINISCVIEERHADLALNVVHENLFMFNGYEKMCSAQLALSCSSQSVEADEICIWAEGEK